MGVFDFLFGKKEKTKTLLLDKPKVIEDKKTSKIVEKASSKTDETIFIKDREDSEKYTDITISLKTVGINLVKIFEEETTEEEKKNREYLRQLTRESDLKRLNLQ